VFFVVSSTDNLRRRKSFSTLTQTSPVGGPAGLVRVKLVERENT
jgi:hypothetical protein